MTRQANGMFRGTDGRNYAAVFALVASLFFLWGFAHSILYVLNKHFQDILVISKARSALVQAMVYGGYFLMAIPAGRIIRRWGYRTGIVTGLLLYGLGALLFIPGGRLMSFPFFLLCLFIIGCGLTCLETSANPYVTVLGEKRSAAGRLNLAQALNGFGWVVGPMVGGLLILGEGGGDISLPYAVIGCIVIILGGVFSRLRMPSPDEQMETGDESMVAKAFATPVWCIRTFRYGVVALLLYVSAQTGINSFFINYVLETDTQLSPSTAAMMLSIGGMGLFMLGRLLGSFILKAVAPARLMAICSMGATLCMVLTILLHDTAGIVFLCLTYLFESVMFPTIFSMALVDVTGYNTKTASSYLVMSIVGGAIAPVLMGLLGESNMALGFLIPLACFLGIVAYALFYKRLRLVNGSNGE